MEKQKIYHPGGEDEPDWEAVLDVKAVLGRLEDVIREFDLGIDLDDAADLERLMGKDGDVDFFLYRLTVLAKDKGFVLAQFFELLGIPFKGDS